MTTIVYLNPPDWDTAALGGSLRVFRPASLGGGSVVRSSAWSLMPGEAGMTGRPRRLMHTLFLLVVSTSCRSQEIEPLPGRLVVFLSGAIDHEVLPSFGLRVAVSSWCQ